MTAKDILELRLTNEQLTQATFTDPAKLIQWFGAVQSQDYPNAKWALGQRINHVTDTVIEEAFTKGEILRTHVMRPTWHFVHPDDIRWMLALTAPQIKRLMTYYNRILHLDEALFQKTQDIFREALQGKKQLTRSELADVLGKKRLPMKGQTLAHVVMWAELDGVLCSGPRKGKQFTYMLLEERAPNAKQLSREESLKELTKRYFQSHGPATVKDFSWWSGLPMADVRNGITLSPSLEGKIIDGKTYYFFRTKQLLMRDDLYLLPNYDEYSIAFKERELFFDPEESKKLPPVGRAAAFSHAMVRHGKIIGMYKKEITKNKLCITPQFFKKPTVEEKEALEKAGKKYKFFLE